MSCQCFSRGASLHILQLILGLPLGSLLLLLLAFLVLLNACIWYANADVLRAIHDTPAAFSLKEERRAKAA